MNNTSTKTKLHKSNILHPPFNDIAPYFSAVIYKIEDKVPLESLFRLAKIECNEENKESNKHYFYFNENYIEDRLGVFTVCHKSIPTWLLNRRVSRTKDEFSTWENYATHLVLIYTTGSYMFLSCQDSRVLGIFQRAISKIDESIVSIIDKGEFQKTHAFNGDEARIIGLKNIFGTGTSGKIPESKAYTGKDSKRSLNGVTDHVFKLSHIGTTSKNGSYSGASIKKRKVWGGWTKSLDHYMEICETYKDALGTDEVKDENSLNCLAQSSEYDEIKGKKPIAFSLDSVVRGKGVLCFKSKENLYTSWSSSLAQFEKDIIEFELEKEKSDSEMIKIKFTFDDLGKVVFEYSSEDSIQPNIVFMNEDSSEPKGRDLVKYLNTTDNFKFLFSGGIAYSTDGCYKMEKLVNCFFENSSTEISWDGVNIKKEEAKVFHPYTDNILQRIEKYTSSLSNLVFATNDNGANEVADIILLFRNKLVFIHAKASKEKFLG